MGVLRQMTAADGDVACTWGDTMIGGVEHLTDKQVTERFDEIIRRGMSAAVVAPVDKMRQIQSIDLTADEIVFIPNIVAG